MTLNPHPQVGRLYAGAILQLPNGQLALQQRQTRPDIFNSGRITAFGGGVEEDETPGQALSRELWEELRLRVAPEEVQPLCVIDKTEEDGSSTRCYFFVVHCPSIERLSLLEGEAVQEASAEEFQLNTKLSDACRSAVSQVILRRRHYHATSGGQFSTVCVVSDSAHDINEDVACVAQEVICLVDGASPRGSTPHMHPVSDARWIADATADGIRTRATSLKPLHVILREAIGDLKSELRRASYPETLPPPSGAVALCRIRNGVVEYAVVADISLAADATHGLWVMEDRISTQREAYLIELERQEGAAAVQTAVVERRTHYMNRPGGYWVLADNPLAVDFARYGFVEMAWDGRLLLATDGFARIVTPFGLADWPDLLEGDEEQLGRLLELLRNRERSDPARESYPRVSPMDDATAILAEVKSRGPAQ